MSTALRSRLYAVAAGILLFASLLPAADRAKTATTVILVRHAEKAPAEGMGSDVPLSAAGQRRAEELARVLGDAGISTIVTTPFARTRQTAAPLAGKLGLKPVELAAGDDYAERFARLVSEHRGETILVVGHSNTTPEAMKALGVVDPPRMTDAEHDDLYVVTLVEGSAPKLVALHYGAASKRE